MAQQSHQWHPAPPQYGASPFQYPPQTQPPSQQQFQYNPSIPSPSTRQQYTYPPQQNQSRFDANSQIPSPNNMPPQFSSTGFNPALFHQFGSSNLLPPPPPSFPPVPLPNGNFPPFIPPPQLPNNFQTQYSPRGQVSQSSIPQQHYRTGEQPSYLMEQRNMHQIEVEPGKDMNDQETAYNRVNVPTSATDSFQQDNTSSHNGLLQHQKVDVSAAASSDRTDSVSSYNPPSATPPESGETPAHPSNGLPKAKLQAGETNKYQGRGAFEMRELAKGALLSLAPHNIRFPELLAEGIDAQLLSQLFEEVGLKTTPNATLNFDSNKTQRVTESNIAQPLPGKPSVAKELASDVQPLADARDSAIHGINSTPAVGKVVRQQASNPATTALAATKATDNRPSVTPIMERKDVIAAMLAAKMGKPVLRKESPGVTPPSLSAKVTPAPPTNVSNTEPPPQSAQPNAINAPSNVVVDESANQSTSKPRSMAKTELVLQKMEQLKRETAAKAQIIEASKGSQSISQSPSASRPPSDLANGLSTYSQASLPPKPVSQEVVMDDTRPSPASASMLEQPAFGSAPTTSAMLSFSIPGLFITDSREPSSSRIPSKRPLAVDTFEDEDLPPAKLQDNRPISSREDDSVTSDQYSDDISEGEIMEIDEGSPVSPLPRAPGYSSFPTSSNASSAWPTASCIPSPTMQRHDTAGGLDSTEASYRPSSNGQHAVAPSKRELELQIMKKKLAEAEDRRRAKQNALQLSSLSSSPMDRPLIPASSPPIALSSVNAPLVKGSSQQQTPQLSLALQENSANTSPSKSPKSSAPIDSVQRAKELREKLLRQRMLKQGLPELDKEVRKTQNRQAEAQARLAQLRREAEKREEEAREARKREQEILEEVKRLEEQLEMGMSGQQQFSEEMETLDREMSPQLVQSAERDFKPQPTANEVPSVAARPAEAVPVDTVFEVSMDDLNDVTPTQNSPPESGDSVSDSTEERMREELSDRSARPSAEAALPTAEEEHAFLEPAVVDRWISEEDVSASPGDSDPHDTADVSPRDDNVSESDESPMEVDSDTDGSASMSDSGSEDYQPAEPIASTLNLKQAHEEDEEYDPMNAPVSNAQPLLPEDQEDYEPSEVVEVLEVHKTPPANFSPISNCTASENEPEHGDDREHGLELTEANTLTNPQEMLPSFLDAADTNNVPRASEPISSHFTPYKSALSNFKSYRFNRQFTDRVPHGYRSLTYSNTIDPAKPLCSTEAQGELCTDINCEEQHFKQMSLADEKILVQMSSANDMPDKAARDRFLAGLKLVIADFSAKQISDFDTVASELAAYRRRFRQEQDPSLAFTSDENEL